MNEIKVFEKEEFGKVRTLFDEKDIWFVAKDVATILGYSDSYAMTKRLDDDEVRTDKTAERNILKNNKGTTFINESGLYHSIIGSKQENAKAFRKWVTSEVLPSIRKTDSQSPESIKEPLMIQDNDKFIFNLSDVDVFEENNWIWFRVSDIGKILEISNTRDWNKWFDDDETKLVSKKSTSDTQSRNYTYIKETALYRILNRSNSPKAKPFERWVTKEVIPSIRKTGSYSVQKISNEDLMAIVVQTNNQIANICASMNEQLKVTTNQTQENTARIEKLEKEFEQKKVEVAPDLPPKEHIIALIRNHADKTKETDYAKLYRQLYSDYGLRTHTNPTVKAKKSNMTTIAFIEKKGDINLLLSIAEKLFGFGISK